MSLIYPPLTLSAVLLSATVISSPSQASILPPTPSEHRDLLSTISLAVTDGVKLPQLEHRDLLSTISLAVTDGVKLPQLEQRNFSAQISLPLTERIKRRPFAVTDGPTASVASVCFITDAGDCGGIEWSENTELDNAEKCRNEGYVDTPCGAGLIPIGTCPYDSNWHSKCGCPSDYDTTCTGADEQGKGDACEGKYKECCNLCTGYDYTADNIPSGYVKSDSCESCNGTKYKARCDVSEGGYMDCGDVVGVGGSCTDDNGTYYKQCNCPLNYEWNDETKTCTCSTSFKYDCQGSAYADTQTGNTCDDKYSSCDCTEGFVWDGESGMCVCDGVDWCALNQDCGALGYAQQTCPKWSIKCPYDTSFVKCIDCPPSFSEECKGTGEVGEGQSCEGKYQSCTCDSSYQYTCTGTGESGSGTACGGKYQSCTCASGYEWKNGACVSSRPVCEIGSLYYSDNTCSNNLESGKTLLGVVIYSNGSSGGGWIMTIDTITSIIEWGPTKTDIPNLPNITSEETLADIQTSCTNTDAITSYGNSSTYPAAWAAKNYNPSGTPSGKSWCLPSGGLLMNINNPDNFNKINNGISTAGGIKLGLGVSYGLEILWSSSEYNKDFVWSFYTNSSGEHHMTYGFKRGFDLGPVRAVMEF